MTYAAVNWTVRKEPSWLLTLSPLTHYLLLQSFMERLHNAYMYLDLTLYMHRSIRPLTSQLW